MNIWIDLGHMPQHNFYRPLIHTLASNGHNVLVTVLDRGRLANIVKNDLKDEPNVKIWVIGKHRMNKLSVYIEVNLLRIPMLFFWALGKKIDISLCNHHQGAIVARILGFPGYTFGDDPQTKLYPLFVKAATQSHMLIYEDTTNGKILPKDKVMPCLKEWAYLNPRTFKPDVKALEAYGVKPKEYIFLREVTVGTINYTGQESGAILGIKDLIPKGMKVLFSLEEKKRRNEYPEDWILLQEPIEDIHSLIYYSAGLVSSGDSMAREAALLGVPAYYLGIRYSMPANAAASKVASLQNRMTMGFEEWIKEYIESKPKTQDSQSSEDDSLLTSPYSAHEQAPGQTNDPSIVANALLNPLQKQTKNAKNSHADENVIEQRMKQQQELRARIDAEFIDINEYMLRLVEGVKE